MRERARSFGSVAEAYERFRPGYPDQVADLVLDYAGRPVRTALEIGAGTGKATRLLASRGIAVTATDPDRQMLAELRRQVPADLVTTVEAAFEDLRLERSFDLVVAAASLHWTRADGRWARMAHILLPGGIFASFGCPIGLADSRLQDAVAEARRPWLEDDGVPSPDGTSAGDAMQWPGTELMRTTLFTDVRQSTVERRYTVPAAGFIGYLSTVSAYLVLPDEVRRRVFDAVLAVLPEQVDVAADLTVHLARRS